MEIEKAIQQKKFKDPYERALVNLLYTGSWLSYQQTAAFKPHGLSMQQYNILRILRGQHPEPITVNALISRMIDKNSNASRIVEKLRAKGLLERKICPADRRRVDVVITEEGLRALGAATQSLEALHLHLRSISDEESETLNDLLNKLRSAELPDEEAPSTN
jgi:DNA-binding MarR family transcriptional regulator